MLIAAFSEIVLMEVAIDAECNWYLDVIHTVKLIVVGCGRLRIEKLKILLINFGMVLRLNDKSM